MIDSTIKLQAEKKSDSSSEDPEDKGCCSWTGKGTSGYLNLIGSFIYLINFLFNPQYSSFKNAISIPSNANISDSAETIKIKMVGAGGELYIRYMTWGFKKCGL